LSVTRSSTAGPKAGCEEVDELALEAVRVLELVDHDRAEAPALALADLRMLLQQVAGEELEVLEVERRLPVLRLAIRGVVGKQELLQLLPVARRERLERGRLDRAARLVQLGRGEVGEVQQLLGQVRRLQVPDRPLVACGSRVLAQLFEPLAELRLLARVDPQLEPGRAKRLVDAREHPAQPPPAVGGEQAQARLVVAAEPLERGAERLAAEYPALAVVEHTEARVDPGRERMRLEQPPAEAVNRRDPSAVELPLEVVSSELVQSPADPPAQLAGGALGVRDHEQRVDVEPALADRLAEALDDHGRLAGAGAGRDEDDALLLDRP
jgi:hypothetical protein